MLSHSVLNCAKVETIIFKISGNLLSCQLIFRGKLTAAKCLLSPASGTEAPSSIAVTLRPLVPVTSGWLTCDAEMPHPPQLNSPARFSDTEGQQRPQLSERQRSAPSWQHWGGITSGVFLQESLIPKPASFGTLYVPNCGYFLLPLIETKESVRRSERL